MKSIILRAAALAAAAGLSGMIACGSTGGCGSTMQNPANSAALTQGSSMTCGPGTTQITTSNGPQCVASSSVGSH